MKRTCLRSAGAATVLLGLLATPVRAQEGVSWNPHDGEKIGERAQAILARKPGSVEGLNLLGLSQLLEQRADYTGEKPELAMKTFLKSYGLRPTQAAAMGICSLLLEANRGSGLAEKKAATWSLRALEFPTASFHALAAFEDAVNDDPKLLAMATPQVDYLRWRRSVWLDTLSRYESRLRVGKVHSRLHDVRVPPDEGRKFSMLGTDLVGQNRYGERLWKQSLGNAKVKLVATGPRVFAITPSTVRVIDAASGELLSKWPSKVIMKHQPDSKLDGVDGEYSDVACWDAWKQPERLVGADQQTLQVSQLRWLCVLRQKDAGGWARFYRGMVKFSSPLPGSILMTAEKESIELRDAKTGAIIWEHIPYYSSEVRLLEVTRDEVVVALTDIGKIVALSTRTGKKVWSLSHQDL